MTRPADIVRKLCPSAKPCYVQAFEKGDPLFKAHGITTPLRLAHFLAQCFHETGGLTIERESGNYSAGRIVEIFGIGHHSAAVSSSEAAKLARNGPALFDRVYGLGNPKKAAELGNTQPGDGWKYRGNGVLQTTGRGNHRRMGQKCGVDFETYPEFITAPAHALKPALAEWSEGDLSAFADKDDIRTITRRINGGYNGLAERQEWFRKIRPLIGAVELKTESTATPAPAKTIPKPAAATPTKAAGPVVTGAAAATAAHQSGVPLWAVIAIGVAVAAVVAFFILRK